LSAALDFTAILSSIFFFFRPLPSQLADRNTTKTGHMFGSKHDLKTYFRNVGIPPHANRGPKTTLRPHNLTATLTAYIFGTKHDIDNRQVRWQLQGVSYTVSKRHELWSTNGLKLGLHLLPILRKFCILLHCQASQTEISKRNSTKLCQTVNS